MLPRRDSPERQLILKEMTFGPVTRDDIAALLRLTTKNAALHLKTLHEDMPDLIRIREWERRKGSPQPVYEIRRKIGFTARDGSPDATRPKKYTHNENQKRTRERYKDRYNAVRRAARTSKTPPQAQK